MLRVTVEIIPFGREEAKRVIGVAEIVNDNTGGREIGNYHAVVKNAMGENLHLVYVEGFPRLESNSWDLIYRVLKKAYGGRKPKKKTTFLEQLLKFVDAPRNSTNDERTYGNERNFSDAERAQQVCLQQAEPYSVDYNPTEPRHKPGMD